MLKVNTPFFVYNGTTYYIEIPIATRKYCGNASRRIQVHVKWQIPDVSVGRNMF
jgi:hypothetical protein